MSTTSKPITVRHRDYTLDIWSAAERLRIYPNRSIHRHHCRQYSGCNSWGLGEITERYEGQLHAQLLRILAQEQEDEADYTERLFRAINLGY